MKKKAPLRKCISCNEMKQKKELLRVVCNKADEITIDNTGKKHGRGAYVCYSSDCFEKAKNKKALNRVFKKQVPDEVYSKMELEIKKHEG
ncbi:MAG: YlxR family protein [Clostridiales bacterium]|nr:YlxR family protein [Clostridiales bacterium]